MVIKNNKVESNNFILITTIFETIFAFPILGEIIIMNSLWSLLIVSLILHILSLISCIKENNETIGNILGIFASVLGWIPILGFILHIISAIFLWRTYLWNKK